MESTAEETKTESVAMTEAPDGGAVTTEETSVPEDGGSEAVDKGKEDGDGAPLNPGGGKKHYNKHSGRGTRRHTPYNRSNNRAVFYQSNEDSDPSCRVYVGNLSWDVTWRELKDHMKTTGCEVSRADVLASPDGRSKGCGIVEFETSEGAKRAVLTLNDTDLMGRQIFVREDREDSSGGGYYTQQPGSGGSRNAVGGETQSRRVYVGNLSWDVAWQDLKDHMRQAGEVIFAEVMNEPDGRSKGCGIVEFATPEEAQEAISSLSDSELKGRMIFVREDRETSGSGTAGGFHGNSRHGSSSVYVGNLAYETSWQDLKDHMRQAGNVNQANILTNEDGRSKGCGIVQYQNPRDCARAIRELQNTVLHDRPIFVREDREQGGGHGGHFHGGYRGSHRGGHDRHYEKSGSDGGHRGGHDKNHEKVGSEGSQSGGGASGCQLFVGNLSYDTTWRELKDHFRQCGDVERAQVIEGIDGRKKGFGTVRFVKAKDAENAITLLNGVELQGRALDVRIDQRAN